MRSNLWGRVVVGIPTGGDFHGFSRFKISLSSQFLYISTMLINPVVAAMTMALYHEPAARTARACVLPRYTLFVLPCLISTLVLPEWKKVPCCLDSAYLFLPPVYK